MQNLISKISKIKFKKKLKLNKYYKKKTKCFKKKDFQKNSFSYDFGFQQPPMVTSIKKIKKCKPSPPTHLLKKKFQQIEDELIVYKKDICKKNFERVLIEDLN